MNNLHFEHNQIEKKWQEKWEKNKIYTPDIVNAKRPFYNLWMFPYPSAEGVHVGTIFSSTGSDVFGRFQRMNGYDVFQPFGYDSFGIHSENYAIKIGETPQKMLARTIARYEKQFKMIGHSYDWTRIVNTSDIDYYRWTQWLFVEMFKAGLAYRKKAFVNWCPGCKTVLADEQIQTPAQAGKVPPGYEKVEDVPEGIKVCERCGNIPEFKELEQWFFRITDYADRLLEDLEKIDWSERVVIAQRNWIGKKQGINITYEVKDTKETITCFTTRPETNFGATFVVVSPEHDFTRKIVDRALKVPEHVYQDISKYLQSLHNISEDNKEKTGVFSGFYAINALTNQEMPIWISNFVLTDFGTGAVVGVPGHDIRDFDFAKKFNLPIKRVVVGKNGNTSEISQKDQVEEGEGYMINSGFLDGKTTTDAFNAIVDYLEQKGLGKRVSNYHLRDWLISRQRYWGPPIPMIFCPECKRNRKSWFDTVSKEKLIHSDYSDWDHYGWYPEENLPVLLPVIEDYRPKGNGKGPLDDHPEFYETTCPYCKAKAKRETDVSDTFLDSSWYFLRYPTVASLSAIKTAFDREITSKWLPVNLYFGGAEHAVLHLMYARFITKALYDMKHIGFDEPFPKFYAHGLMIKDGAKMSKSRGNVVNPDEYIAKFGADTLRLYLMFMGPMDGYPDFRDTGIEGMKRFVDRLWNIFNHSDIFLEEDNKKKLLSLLNRTIKKVTEDISCFHYNTAISAIMELVNLMRDLAKESARSGIEDPVWRETKNALARMIAPFAPHLAEEVWCEVLKQPFSVHKTNWPKFDANLIKDSEIKVIVQVDGRVRAIMSMRSEDAKIKQTVVESAYKIKDLDKWVKKSQVKNVIFVPGKVVNFVTK
ncbi:MAG: leucine--tRNA ligase [Patescibacteria group bacterium]|nr:leucine--tRNA ligase [Patescibacteria group bacterium]